jgi:branched-chain amino acid transport system permease protein
MSVVLGGAGSLLGVLVGTILVIGLPELFRTAESWRLLAFGIALVLLMVWRPSGLIRHRFKVDTSLEGAAKGSGSSKEKQEPALPTPEASAAIRELKC